MSKMSCPFAYSVYTVYVLHIQVESIYKNGQDVLAIQYLIRIFVFMKSSDVEKKSSDIWDNAPTIKFI